MKYPLAGDPMDWPDDVFERRLAGAVLTSDPKSITLYFPSKVERIAEAQWFKQQANRLRKLGIPPLFSDSK